MKSTKLIKTVSLDVATLFKNFLHWNISKLIISIASILLGLFMALPFIVVLLVLYFSFGLQVYFSSPEVNILSILSFLGEHPLVFFIFMLFALLGGLTGLFGYSYRKILFTKLNLAYIDGEKLPYKKNSYFDLKLVWKYIGVITLISLFVLIPVLVFLTIFFALFFGFGGSDGVQTMINSSRFNPFTVITFILFIVCLIAFLYIGYRLYFAVIMLADDKKHFNEKAPIYYLRESFNCTKSTNTLLKFISIILLTTVVILPFGSLNDYFTTSLHDVRNYQDFQTLSDEQKKTLEEGSSNYYINKIKIEYANLGAGDLKKLETSYFYLSYLSIIINFLLIFGLLEMVLVSFYKHEILAKKSLLDTLVSKL